MITSIVFDDTIPYTISLRASRFTLEDGWLIEEQGPGRVRLAHVAHGCVIVQSMPYVLQEGDAPPEPAPVTETTMLRAENVRQTKRGR